MMAVYIHESIRTYPGTRIMALAHVKELLDQNRQTIEEVDPHLDIGSYSASLRKRDTQSEVIVAGIQSCYDKADEFGYIDLLIIDECHLVNPRNMGRYCDFIEGIKRKNPKVKVIGFTATPYRLGHGYIHKGGETLFDGIAYDIPVELLIERGYLVRPRARSGSVQADLSKVRIRSGEFVEREMSDAFCSITEEAVRDVLMRSLDRRCGLVFCSGLAHADQTAEAFRRQGEQSVAVVTGKTSDKERAQLVEAVKNGQLRWLINVAVFTTGFDAPNIDVIVFLRATQSTALYVQMIGRGLRLHPDKRDCLVLDYGENVMRHGPLNALVVRQPGQREDAQQVRAKICPQCEELVPINARECPMCKYAFPIEEREVRHGTTASEAELIAGSDPIWHEVRLMKTGKHVKLGKQPSMRVDYYIGEGILEFVSEWVCFDHPGYAQKKADLWARERGANWMPLKEALVYPWPTPKRVLVRRNEHGFFNIIEVEFKKEEYA